MPTSGRQGCNSDHLAAAAIDATGCYANLCTGPCLAAVIAPAVCCVVHCAYSARQTVAFNANLDAGALQR